eukprot:RCo017680
MSGCGQIQWFILNFVLSLFLLQDSGLQFSNFFPAAWRVSRRVLLNGTVFSSPSQIPANRGVNSSSLSQCSPLKHPQPQYAEVVERNYTVPSSALRFILVNPTQADLLSCWSVLRKRKLVHDLPGAIMDLRRDGFRTPHCGDVVKVLRIRAQLAIDAVQMMSCDNPRLAELRRKLEQCGIHRHATPEQGWSFWQIYHDMAGHGV